MANESMHAAPAGTVVDLGETRRMIDSIDPQIRELLMRRLKCSYQVALAKNAAGETNVYRADREAAILERLGAEVPENLRAGYLSVVRKIMETSRMYQYGLLYDWNEGIFSTIPGSEAASRPGRLLTVRVGRPDHPNAMSAVLSMIGDYGFDMEAMTRLDGSAVPGARQADASSVAGEGIVYFELTIRGDISTTHMRKLVFQLFKECQDFTILRNE